MASAMEAKNSEGVSLLSEKDMMMYVGQSSPGKKGVIPAEATKEMASRPVADSATLSQHARPRTQAWATGLFDCCKFSEDDPWASTDCEICALGCFAPCVLYGSTAERLRPQERSRFGNSACCYLGLFVLGKVVLKANCIAPLYTYPTRTELRSKYNLQGGTELYLGQTARQSEEWEAACDCCLHFWCHPCALCQEAREVRRRIPFAAGPSVVVGQPVCAPPPQLMLASAPHMVSSVQPV